MPFREKGVPSVQQIEDKTTDFNKYYHQAGDTVEHMDAEYWQSMMRGLAATIATWAGLVPEPATPLPTTGPTPSPAATPTPRATPFEPPPASPTPLEIDPPAPNAIHLPVTYCRPRD